MKFLKWVGDNTEAAFMIGMSLAFIVMALGEAIVNIIKAAHGH